MLRNPVERTLSEYFWGRANWCLSYEHSQAWSPALCEVANDGQLKNSRGMEWDEQQVIDWLHSPYNLGLNRQVRSASTPWRASLDVRRFARVLPFGAGDSERLDEPYII